MTEFIRSNGWVLHLGNDIGGGGEGRIYQTVEEPHLVAKLYTTVKQDREAKLNAMLAQPPYTHTRSHFPLAWPTELLYNRGRQCVGFLMPYIDPKDNFPLLKLYNPRDRLQTLYDFSWKYLLHAAMNLASTVNVLHNNGYIIGDINESNILISRSALVTFVDCDSIQVPRRDGGFFRCAVGKPEYTPPELQGRDFHALDRKPHHDNFGLAVLIFQMLMEGIHPFSGIWQGEGNPPTLEQNIQVGNSPYLPNSILNPPRRALSFQTLPESIQALMRRCLGEGHRDPTKRPTAYEWYEELHLAKKQIVSCDFNSQHWYSNHLSSCPWCDRMSQGIPDTFPLEAPAIPKLALRPTTVQMSPPIYATPPYPTSSYPTSSYPTSSYPTSSYPTATLRNLGHQPHRYPKLNYPAAGYPKPANAPMPIQSSQVQMQYQSLASAKPHSSYQRYPSHYPYPSSSPINMVAVAVEIVLSIFGIFGIGWCMAGKMGRGIALILCSFLIYWPLMISFFDGQATCAIAFAIGAIIFNTLQLIEEVSKRP